MSLAQTEGIKHFASKKNDDGSWVYPQVRSDLEKIKENHANEMFHVEHRAVLAETAADSLGIKLMVSNARHENNKWYDNLELGIIAGAALTVFIMWGVGQVGHD